MSLEPRQKYGFGSFVRSITKPISKIADKLIPNEVAKAINSVPGPVKAALMFTPAAPFVSAAQAVSTLHRGQGRGLSLGDLASLAGSYYAYGKSGGTLPGGKTLPGFTGTQYTGPGSQLFTDTTTSPVTKSPVVDSTVTPDATLEFAGTSMGEQAGIKTIDAAQYSPGAVSGTDIEASIQQQLDIDRLGKAPVSYAEEFTTSAAQQAGKEVAQSSFDQFLSNVREEGIGTALKEAGKDVLGVEQFTEIGSAVADKDIMGVLKSTKDLIVENPTLVIGSTSLMAYLTAPQPYPGETSEQFAARKAQVNDLISKYGQNLGSDIKDFDSASDFYSSYRKNLGYAVGGRVNKQIGGIMDLPPVRDNGMGVNELDYRDQGGFVPVGVKEKADDVPAMLSKNEFVMTADAVRGMGNGDIETGAQRMYNMMKTLENGGTV